MSEAKRMCGILDMISRTMRIDLVSKNSLMRLDEVYHEVGGETNV